MTSAALIDQTKHLGTLTRVTAGMAELTLPDALAAAGRRGLAKGSVGDFVFIDCDRDVILGRITEVQIPDRQRLQLEQQIRQDIAVDPAGRVQLLATIHKTTRRVVRGINTQPRIGDAVYLAGGEALTTCIQDALNGGVDAADSGRLSVKLGTLSGLDGATISIPPEKLFGRHCGIFGATGGGKSWTLSRLVNETVRLGGKCILFDPTGEFTGKISNAEYYAFTQEKQEKQEKPTPVHFPSSRLAEQDLYALLTPNGQSQAPTLRNAIKSLRLVSALLNNKDKDEFKDKIQIETSGDNKKIIKIIECGKNYGSITIDEYGTLIKKGNEWNPISKLERIFHEEIRSEECNFSIKNISRQIYNECVHPTGFGEDINKFGNIDTKSLSNCTPLIVRAESIESSPDLSCIFKKNGTDICSILEKETKNIIVISFEHVSYKHNTREILLNAIGRYLLRLARKGQFREMPTVCFLDEAHQFLDKSIGDEANRMKLDAFGLIAKEGRKYGLTTVIATQRPRDVPEAVLSQLGTLFVHRLTNDRDRETIERACGDLDRNAAAFIPSLAQGEVIIVGPDLPTPLPIMMTKPPEEQQPDSHGPQYQKFWGKI